MKPVSNDTEEKCNKRKRYHYDEPEIKRLLKDGKTIPQIAAHFDIKLQSMRNYIRKHKADWDIDSIDESIENEEIPTMEEKIAYCNEKYGVGNWHFMTREELISALKFEQEKRMIEQELSQ